MYGNARQLAVEVALDVIRPPKRVKVSEAAKESLVVEHPSGSWVKWDDKIAPYMLEAMDLLTSRRYQAVVFMGPARSSKTVTLDAWLAYVITCAPADMLICHTSRDLARAYSMQRIDRIIQFSPSINERMSRKANDDNTFDKRTKSGHFITIGWPTITQLSSRNFKYCASTDYDRRRKDDVEGEGDLFTQLKKRTTTFLSSGMTYIESSPGFEITDPHWTPKNEHEAPPCEGIASIYSLGDRRRYYWQCQACSEYFIGRMELFSTIESSDMVKTAESVRLACPHCGYAHEFAEREALNKSGVWLREGETISAQGERGGNPRNSNIASFWLEGPAACYQKWSDQVLNLALAEEEYERTGAEEKLLAAFTLDQARPYRSKAISAARDPNAYMARAVDVEARTVPEGVLCLFAGVDVQGGAIGRKRFVVQVIGIGNDMQRYVVDRFNIRDSLRLGDNGEPHPIQPDAYVEDWDTLIDGVIKKAYPLADGSGYMPITLVACDSGGEEGVTNNAYGFFRRLKREKLHQKFKLVKGASLKTAPPIEEKSPDNTKRKDRKADARGDVPVFFLNVNTLKDTIANSLNRTEIGPGYIHFPNWLGSWFFEELTYEVRRADGSWVKPGKGNNEAFDLFCYCEAMARLKNLHKVKWDNPPVWLLPWDKNPEIIRNDETSFTPAPKKKTRRRIRARF